MNLASSIASANYSRLLCSFAVCLIAAAADAQSDDPAADLPPTIEQRLSDPVYMAWVRHSDLNACIECHYDGPNVAQIAGNTAGQLTPFSRREELEFWLSRDKHAIARRRVEPFSETRTKAELQALIASLNIQARAAAERLRAQGIRVDRTQIGLTEFPKQWIGESNFLSRRICEKLGYAVETPEGYSQFREHCLTCHGGYQPGASGFDLAGLGNAQIGISCLYCHQNGENETWVKEHWVSKDWRYQTPDLKAEAGMRDLVGTAHQADLCLDCHIGNRDKDMFVTHEMYAAGHPPLPSIELQTFCSEMPQHWQTPDQLHQSISADPRREEYFVTNYPGVIDATHSPDQTYWSTRKILVGSLVAKQKSLELLIDSAESNQWADYALYDCASCHHELRSSSVRQLRGFPAAPGRPRQQEWPDTILNIAAVFSGRDKLAETRQCESDLAQALGAQPFGAPEQVAPVAMAMQSHLSSVIESVEQKPVDARIARAVLVGLSRTPDELLITYDAARQVTWAMNAIVREIQQHGGAIDEDVAMTVRGLGDPSETGIDARLPSGREQFIYPDYLQEDFVRRADFDPARFSQQMRKIRQALQTAQP